MKRCARGVQPGNFAYTPNSEPACGCRPASRWQAAHDMRATTYGLAKTAVLTNKSWPYWMSSPLGPGGKVARASTVAACVCRADTRARKFEVQATARATVRQSNRAAANRGERVTMRSPYDVES